MKKWLKRFFCMVLVSVMILGLCSCGKKGTDPALIAASKENVYKYVEVPIFERIEDTGDGGADYSVYSMAYENDRVVALVNYNYWTMDSWGNEVQLVSVKLDGSDRQVTTIWDQSGADSDGTYLNQAMMSEHYAYAIMQKENYEIINEYGMPEMTCELVCWDFSGNEQWRVSVIPEDLSPEEWFYVDGLISLKDDQVLVSALDTMTIIDKNGNTVGTVKPQLENGFNNIFVDKNGNLIVSVWSQDWTQLNLVTVDVKTGSLSEPLELPFNMNNYNVKSSNVYDLLLTSNTGVFGYNMGDAEPTPIMNYINSDLSATSINQIAEISDTQFLASYYDRNARYQCVSMFTYVDPATIPDKQVIRIAANYMPYDMRNRIIEFNKTNENYRIITTEYNQYSTGDDYLAGYTKLNNDILAGNIPDILVLDDNMPVDSYIAKGLFADIYEFIDADEELNREDYFENVLEAYSIDGKLYQITPSFYVQTVLAKSELVGDEPGWTFKEMQEVLAKMPEGASAFGSEQNRSSLMWYITMYALPEYIDKETGKCNFDSQGFKDLLAFLKTIPEEITVDYEDPDYWTNYEMQYMQDKTLLMTTSISDLQSMIYTFGRFGTTDLTFIGFPSENGLGAVITCYETYAISESSPNKEGAWEFMRYYYTDEYQENLYEMSINKEIWKEKAKSATERYSWEDENGEIHYEDYTYWFGNEQVVIDPLTQEQVDEIFDYVSSITTTYSYDQSLIDIINEEAAFYFAGDKTVDEVATVIQGRIQLYVDENR